MDRLDVALLGSLAVLLGGCPDDPPITESGSSTDGTAEGTAPPPTDSGSTPTTLDGTTGGSTTDTTTDTTTTDSATTDDTTTTGPETFGRARFLVREPIPANNYFDLVLYEYAEGELSAPLSLTPSPPAEGGVSFAGVPASGEHVTYTVVDPFQASQQRYLIDLTTDPPGPEQPFAVPPIPASSQVGTPIWVEDAQTFVLRVVDAADPTDQTIYSATLGGGTLQAPQLVATPSLGIALNEIEPRPDGAWVAYVDDPDVGSAQVFLASLGVPSPGSELLASDIVDPSLHAESPVFVPGLDALIYAADTTAPGSTVEELRFVDFSGPMPNPSIRVDDPLDDALEVRGPRIAPDGHALVYWVGTGLTGDLMFVDLSPGTPQLPVLVSTLGADQVQVVDFGWSPDSRWIVYRAAHEQPDTFDLHLAEAPGSTPGAPLLATGGIIPDGAVLGQVFAADSSWLYYVAQQEAINPELFRVDVTGAMPAPAQKVSGPLSATGVLSGELVFSHDGSMVLYTAEDGEPRAQELYLVDVSGPEPGEATRINAPLPEDVDVRFGAEFSLDDTVVFYGETSPPGGDATPVRLVDLLAGTVTLVSDDASNVLPVVD